MSVSWDVVVIGGGSYLSTFAGQLRITYPLMPLLVEWLQVVEKGELGQSSH